MAVVFFSGLYNKTITRTYETVGVAGRPTGFNVGAGGADYSATFGYDPATGRFESVSWNINGATAGSTTYSYVPDSGLIYQRTTGSQTTTYAYEPDRNLITQVKNDFGATTISQLDYLNSSLGQRTSETQSGKAYAQALNAKLTGQQWFADSTNQGQGIEILPETRNYNYDPIGKGDCVADPEANMNINGTGKKMFASRG